MQKIFFLFLLSILLANSGSAQIRVGVKSGLLNPGITFLSSNFDVSETSEIATIYVDRYPGIRLMGGVLLDFKMGNLFTLRPNILYKNKTWEDNKIIEFRNGRTNSDSSEEYHIKYIEVPVHIIYSSPLGDGKLYIGAGPYFSYALNGNYLYRARPADGFKEEDIKFDIKQDNSSSPENNNLHRIDYGLSSVIGYEFTFGLLVDVGYDLGLRNIFVNPQPLTGPKSKYNVFTLCAGYLINRKRK